jgi:hypothetical protein
MNQWPMNQSIAILATLSLKKVGIGWYLSVFSGKIYTHHYQIRNF